MYGLPSSTEMRRSLPKKTIYSRFELRAAQRDRFDADISRIDIVAEVSPATVPALTEGERVKNFICLTSSSNTANVRRRIWNCWCD